MDITGGLCGKNEIVATLLAIGLVVFCASVGATTPVAPSKPTPSPPSNSASHGATHCPAVLRRDVIRLQDEKPQNLCQYAGKVVVVVNTASFCGFTSQYKGLEDLHKRYRDRGLVVLGFPSNDFGAQEPGSNKDIAAFCESTFGVKFPMFTKTRVAASSGASLSPLYADLKQMTGASPQWNFHKYVIARNGVTALSFASAVEPTSAAFTKQLELLLDAK
jgi:glutathione peroxidase